MPRVLGGSWGGGRFLMSEVTLYTIWSAPPTATSASPYHCRASMAHTRQSKPGSGRLSGDRLRKGCCESRRCSRDTYPETYITQYTSIQRYKSLNSAPAYRCRAVWRDCTRQSGLDSGRLSDREKSPGAVPSSLDSGPARPPPCTLLLES